MAQPLAQKLQKAFQQFEADSQLRYAISSLYVVDAKTGEVLFDKNSRVGLAPASTQKIITSVTAFELLGTDFRYKTQFWFLDHPFNPDGVLLYIKPSGDPSFGSWRWNATKEAAVYQRLTKAIKTAGIKRINAFFVETEPWKKETLPGGWTWQDIGNYYGAGSQGLNWRENQYDYLLQSGNKVGDNVKVAGSRPPILYDQFNDIECLVSSAPKGSGDNAYIFLPIGNTPQLITGTIPVDESGFSISGALVNPAAQFIGALRDSLDNGGSMMSGVSFNNNPDLKFDQAAYKLFHTEISPSLDSIIYWFNKRSINLYGEALIKTFSYQTNGYGLTDSGIVILKNFWKEKGLDEDELNIYDGSGLSPLNRVTTHAQVEILKYARSRDWFQRFYNSLPDYNNMRIKSGTINNVKGFCGYHTAKNGEEYIFSFLVNNYNGKASHLVNKMYKVLDMLK
jgi:D-alanyl-D-alanine carboxypeptidase/D-alanyl-D-alanine-endopeptidase (penicillin-binding protein 4)